MRVTLYKDASVLAELDFPSARTVLECLPLITIPEGATHWRFSIIDRHCEKCWGPPKGYRW